MPNKLFKTELPKPTTLAGVHAGKKVKVIGLPSGRDSIGRLVNLGIGPGVELEVMTSHPFRGPVVVRVDGNPVAIGHGLAARITIEEVAPADNDNW